MGSWLSREQLSPALVYMPPVVDDIFRYLNARDLAIAAQVNPDWNRGEAIAMGGRTEIHFGSFCGKDNPEYKDQLVHHLQSLPIKAAFSLVFRNRSEDDKSYTKYYTRRSLGKRLARFLDISTFKADGAPTTGFLVLTSLGVTATSSDRLTINNSENPLKDESTLSSIVFPPMPNVHFGVVTLVTLVNGILGRKLSTPYPFKCILVFIYSDVIGPSFTNNTLLTSLRAAGHTCAVAGGYVDKVDMGKYLGNADLCLGYGVIFMGKNVSAVSIVVPRYKQTPKGVEEKLLQLYAAYTPGTNSVAFMFSASPIYEFQDLATATFKRIFPNVPLSGTHGWHRAIIGANCLPDPSTGRLVLEDPGNIEMACVFVIITFEI